MTLNWIVPSNNCQVPKRLPPGAVRRQETRGQCASYRTLDGRPTKLWNHDETRP
jgi:hypothetical protein